MIMAQEADVFGDAPGRKERLPEVTDLNRSRGPILQGMGDRRPRKWPIASKEERGNDQHCYHEEFRD